MYTRTQKRRYNRNKNKILGTNDDGIQSSTIPRSLQPATLMPSQLTRTIEYRPMVNILKTGVADYALVEFKVNSPYDPEAAVTGNQPAGFNSIMAFYLYCLVEGCSVEIQIANREIDVDIVAGWILRDGQPSSTINDRDSAILSLGVGPRVAPKLLANTNGMNRAVLRQPYIQNAAILGNPLAYQGGQSFSCAANADPAQVLWGALIIYSEEAGIFMPNGVSYEITIKMKTKFYSLRTEVQ